MINCLPRTNRGRPNVVIHFPLPLKSHSLTAKVECSFPSYYCKIWEENKHLWIFECLIVRFICWPLPSLIEELFVLIYCSQQMQGWKSLVDHIGDHSLTPVWIIIIFHHQEISCSYIGWKSIRSIGLWDQQNKWRRHFPNRLHWLELCRKQSKRGNVVKGKDKSPQLIKDAMKTERRDMKCRMHGFKQRQRRKDPVYLSCTKKGPIHTTTRNQPFSAVKKEQLF